jgi:superfamily II DNA or RNA helicase
MILKSAIRDFLNRSLRNLNEMCSLSADEIDEGIASLDPQPKFVTNPLLHQRVCFYLLARCPQVLLWLEMGLGKTKIVLDSFRWYKSAGRLHRLLVCVPNVVNIEEWRDQIAQHAPDLSAVYVEGGRDDRIEALHDESDICVVTYAGLNWLVCESVGRQRSPGRELRIQPGRIKDVRRLFDAVVWDESTSVMNHQSLSFRVARSISQQWFWRVAMSGTPFGRDPAVLWPQLFLVDHGESLGETLGLMRAALFVEKPNYWSGGRDYVFDRRMMPDLRRMVAHSSIHYGSDECIDLPPLVLTKLRVRMTDEQWSYYTAMLDGVRQQHSTGVTDVENVFVRLRQVTSGFVSIDGRPSRLSANPKLDALCSLVAQIPNRCKFVVFHEFIHSGAEIEDALISNGVSCVRLYGETRDHAAVRRQFVSGTVRGLIANSKSGAMGLNLQCANYIIMYESPSSPIIRSQAIGRCHRQGQRATTFVYDLVGNNTVDERILEFIAQGKDLFEALTGEGWSVLLS